MPMGAMVELLGEPLSEPPNNPRLVRQTNVTVTDFREHPNILVRVRPGLNSTAAGRYQVLNGTWNTLNLPSFSAANQDTAAVMLLQNAGAIAPLQQGNVPQAATNANGTWASLPASPYGQPTRAMNDFVQAYNNAFAACQAANPGHPHQQ